MNKLILTQKTKHVIETLRTEASSAGDHKQALLCNLAINGNGAAFEECFNVIKNAGHVESNWCLRYTDENIIATNVDLNITYLEYVNLILKSLIESSAGTVKTTNGINVYADDV